MDLKEIVKLWKQCEKETKEKRFAYTMEDGEKRYYKVHLDDFMMWLSDYFELK